MKVYVFVATLGGLEDTTEVYRTAEAAERRYVEYAEACGVPYDPETGDYDWSCSDHAAWWSECEIKEENGGSHISAPPEISGPTVADLEPFVEQAEGPAWEE